MNYEKIIELIWIIPISWIVWRIKMHDSKDLISRDKAEEIIQSKVDIVTKKTEGLESKVDIITLQLNQISIGIARIEERIKIESGEN